MAGVYQGKLSAEVFSLRLAPSHTLDKLWDVVGHMLEGTREKGESFAIAWRETLQAPNCELQTISEKCALCMCVCEIKWICKASIKISYCSLVKNWIMATHSEGLSHHWSPKTLHLEMPGIE